MVKSEKLLPIGSVVLLQSAVKKLMIIGVYQNIQRSGENVDNYDYIGVLYPEGFLNMDSMMLFNHEQICDVVFTGYDNVERKELINYIDKEVLGEKVEASNDTEI